MKQKIFDITAPKKECADKNCPFHGEITVKKEFITGIVVKKDTHNSATIEWIRSYLIRKYERFEMRRSRLRVHNPPCVDAQKGQKVVIARTRPLSKTKNHIILKVIEEEKIKVIGEDKKQ